MDRCHFEMALRVEQMCAQRALFGKSRSWLLSSSSKNCSISTFSHAQISHRCVLLHLYITHLLAKPEEWYTTAQAERRYVTLRLTRRKENLAATRNLKTQILFVEECSDHPNQHVDLGTSAAQRGCRAQEPRCQGFADMCRGKRVCLRVTKISTSAGRGYGVIWTLTVLSFG